jgi:hypothetical protein
LARSRHANPARVTPCGLRLGEPRLKGEGCRAEVAKGDAGGLMPSSQRDFIRTVRF